jgi:D-aminoacyl-tRNA deacylase
MQNIALVYSEQDSAGINIAKQIETIGTPKWAKMYSFKEKTIHLPLEKLVEKDVIVLSKHASSMSIKSLTTHSIGNFSKAEYGGDDKKLVNSLPRIQTNFLRGLAKRNKNEEYTVCFEVTHHGPFTEKNVCFIELGSTINEWNNEDEAKIIANTIVEDTLKKNNDIVAIGIGGGHYTPDFTKLALRKNYSFGHVCPQYALESLDAELLSQMIEKSKAKEIILDWKGLKGNKEKIISLCNESGLPFERVQRLLKD